MKRKKMGGIGLFYHRDSEGQSELVPPQYVRWARTEAARLGVTLRGKPDDISRMVKFRMSELNDLYLDYGISGNVENRLAFDAFRRRALTKANITHLFVMHRDRVSRPSNPFDGIAIEMGIRKAGLTIVYHDLTLNPIVPGQQVDQAELFSSVSDYSESGKFRRDLARKVVNAKVQLAEMGFSIGGEPPYGFDRWLSTADGQLDRKLTPNEVVKKAGFHVATTRAGFAFCGTTAIPGFTGPSTAPPSRSSTRRSIERPPGD